VAEAKEVKMPVCNLAKVFGRIILGQSRLEADAHMMFEETKTQQAVLEALINMPPDFWSNLVCRQQNEVPVDSGTCKLYEVESIQSSFAFTNSSTHNSFGKTQGSSRKIYFTDDSTK